LARERERGERRAFESSFRIRNETGLCIDIERHSVRLDRLIYTRCALCGSTPEPPQLSYFPCRRWIWQNNRRQGAQHSHVIATDSVAIATTDGSIHILLWCMLYLR
jgi:hypothetical protein